MFIKCAVVDLVKVELCVNRIIEVYHKISSWLQGLQKRYLPLLGCILSCILPYPSFAPFMHHEVEASGQHCTLCHALSRCGR